MHKKLFNHKKIQQKIITERNFCDINQIKLFKIQMKNNYFYCSGSTTYKRFFLQFFFSILQQKIVMKVYLKI